MMKMMAAAFAPYKIRCNVIAPGLFPSELAGGIINSLSSGATAAMDGSIIPAERARKEEDIADTMLYRASKAGRGVSEWERTGGGRWSTWDASFNILSI
jgi:NAD(P)-dependent dehydrogenase (short-subunit alcohol dehydrogenase family)